MPFDSVGFALPVRRLACDNPQPRLAYGPLYCGTCKRAAPAGAVMGGLCTYPSLQDPTGPCPGSWTADWQPD